MSDRNTVQSVARAAQILEALTARGGIATITQLAADTALATTTVHRITATFVETGVVRQGPDREYLLGPSLMWSGAAAQHVTKKWALPILQQVVEATGETANLAAREGDHVVYLAQVPSPYSMRMFTEVGRRVDVHCTAVGKALVAELDDAVVRELLGRAGMRRYTANTVVRADDFVAELARVREHGFAGDESEQEEGVRCVAVAHGRGRSRIAVSVSGPEARFTYDKRGTAAEAIRTALHRSRYMR